MHLAAAILTPNYPDSRAASTKTSSEIMGAYSSQVLQFHPSQVISLQGHSSHKIAHSMLPTPIIPKSIATPFTYLYQPIIGCPFLDNAGFAGSFFFLFFPLLVNSSGSSFINSVNKNSQCSFHHSGFHT